VALGTIPDGFRPLIDTDIVVPIVDEYATTAGLASARIHIAPSGAITGKAVSTVAASGAAVNAGGVWLTSDAMPDLA
jgi:hypothetical protein